MNQYPYVGSGSYTYDGNGNLTSDGTWTYTYNTKNQLVSASTSGTEVDFVYDPLNRQTQKSVTTTGTVKTRYLYAGWQRIADYDGTTGDLQNSYYYGAGLDEPLFQVAGSTVTYIHGNNQGSVVATSDGSGAASSAIVYGPFGDTPALSGTTFGYTGQRYDAETGLYYYKQRYYSPVIGRFLQPDPVRSEGLNRYAYALNNPLTYRDPFGLVPLDGGTITLGPPANPQPGDTWVDENGDFWIRNANESTSHIEEDGTVVTYYDSGWIDVQSPDGTVTTFPPGWSIPAPPVAIHAP